MAVESQIESEVNKFGLCSINEIQKNHNKRPELYLVTFLWVYAYVWCDRFCGNT